MDYYAYEPLLTTNGVTPQPYAAVQFFDADDTAFRYPLQVFGMDELPLKESFAPRADIRGYINNAGGFKLQVAHAVAKSPGLPAKPVYSVQGIIADAALARTEAAEGAALELAERIAAGEFNGEPGRDGANVATTRDAVAAELDDPESPSRAVLSATIAEATVGKANVSAVGTSKASRVFTLAGLGDSITDGTASANDADRYTDTTWLHLTHALSMGKIVSGGNFGVGGNTIAQMLARIPDVIASGATACLILGGTNDVAQLATEAAVLANIDRLFIEGHDILAANGVQPVCATIPPRGRSTAASTPDHRLRIAKANARIRRYAEQRGYPLVDFHKILVDPATGMYRDEANLAVDAGVHPNPVYCRKMAEAVTAAVSPMAGGFSADLTTWAGDPTNLLPNPLFLGTTSTIGGFPMPAGWNGGTANQRAVVAPVAADNLLGNWFDVAKDATVAAATNGDVTANSPSIAAGPTTFEVGDRVRFACRARIENFEGGANSSAGLHFITLTLYLSGSNTNRSPMWQWASNIGDAVPSIEFTVPAGTTAIALQAAIYGQGKLRIGQVTLRNLTKLGLT